MIIFIFLILLLISIAINVIFFLYSKQMLRKYFYASESASEIFSRLDAYKQHLKSIYELEMFYGDKNLKEVIDHTKNLIDFLKKYNDIYSFTQPELEKILREENITDDEDEQVRVDKIFITRKNEEKTTN